MINQPQGFIATKSLIINLNFSLEYSTEGRDHLETGSDQRQQAECICFADSAMIVHVVLESAEVSSCCLRNISRTAYNVYGGAQVTDVP